MRGEYFAGYGDGKLKFLHEIPEKYIEIDEKNINFFMVKGEEQYITQVSGGGGGGSSLGGAVVGGFVGGAVGAVIGSRKSTEAIQTTTTHIDRRNTYLSFNDNGEDVVLVFLGADLGDFLTKYFPQKDYDIVQFKQANNNA